MSSEENIRRLLALAPLAASDANAAAAVRQLVGVDADAAMTPEEIQMAMQAGLWQQPMQGWQIEEAIRLGIIPGDIETARV